MSQFGRLRLDEPVFVCLRNSCSHVAEVGEPEVLWKLVLKVVTQNDGDFVKVIILYLLD
jgi:hypothetical protein